MKELKIGDILFYEGDVLIFNGDKIKVLGIWGENILISQSNDFSEAASHTFTKEELIKIGWVLDTKKFPQIGDIYFVPNFDSRDYADGYVWCNNGELNKLHRNRGLIYRYKSDAEKRAKEMLKK